MYFLHEQGFNIILANPGKAKKYADALNIIHKTDKSDATMLAHYGSAKHAVVNYLQSEALEVWELKALIRHLDALESNRQRKANRLEISGFSNVSRVFPNL